MSYIIIYSNHDFDKHFTYYLFPASVLSLHVHLTDMLDAVENFRRKKRLHSEMEEEEELSLTEYLARKMKEGEGPQKKRVCTVI